MILKELKKEFEELFGEVRVLEEDMPSTYKVVNPTALWKLIEKAFKEGKKERDSKSKFVEVVVEEQRACSECLLKLGDIVPECFTCAGTGKEKYFIKIGTKKLKSKQP